MILRQQRSRPLPWSTYIGRARRKATVPFFALEWFWEWLAFLLSNWMFVEVVEYAGTLSLLIAVFLYFHDADNRTKQRHFQAW
jgi:hypothetical protein